MRRSVFALLIALLAFCSGCTQDEVASLREGEGVPDGLACTVDLERQVRVRDGAATSRFSADIELTGLPVGDSDQLHLVWTRPDGLELFRKFAVVEVAPRDEGFTVNAVWKDAEDLHGDELKAKESDAPALSVTTRLGINPERSPGDYSMKVYWNRELMAQESITLAEVAPTPAAAVEFCRRVGTKTGKRIEIGDEFAVREGKKYKYVNGFVDLAGLPLDETHAFHLIWVSPNGKEMFRKSGTLNTVRDDEGYLHQLVWNKKNGPEADDPLRSESPSLSLSSRLNVAPSKERALGTYRLVFLWDWNGAGRGEFELTD